MFFRSRNPFKPKLLANVPRKVKRRVFTILSSSTTRPKKVQRLDLIFQDKKFKVLPLAI